VLCGTPIIVAGNVGCSEVVEEPAAVRFTLDDATSFEHAIAQAVERWRQGTHRLAQPAAQLGYDPSVAVHVDALLTLATRLTP
jgi:hypothetical protein